MTDTYALVDRLIDMGVTYIHASLPDALHAKPVDATDDVTYLEALSQHINQRVLLVAAGMIQTPQQAEAVLEKGALPAIGHGFVTEPLWMEKAEAGQGDDIRLSIKTTDVADLCLPEKMWTAIQNSGDWFTIE